MTAVIIIVVVAAVAVLGAVGVLVADRIVGRLAGARPPSGAETERLSVYTEALCLGAGLPVPRMKVIDDEAASALAYGRSPRAATVAVTTGLLDVATSAELEASVAHLLGRIKDGTARRDTRLALLSLLGGPLGAALAARFRDPARVVAADVAAARMTRFPPGVAGALRCMAIEGEGSRRRPAALRHMWMHDALGPGSHRIHVDDRITVLRDL